MNQDQSNKPRLNFAATILAGLTVPSLLGCDLFSGNSKVSTNAAAPAVPVKTVFLGQQVADQTIYILEKGLKCLQTLDPDTILSTGESVEVAAEAVEKLIEHINSRNSIPLSELNMAVRRLISSIDTIKIELDRFENPAPDMVTSRVAELEGYHRRLQQESIWQKIGTSPEMLRIKLLQLQKSW